AGAAGVTTDIGAGPDAAGVSPPPAGSARRAQDLRAATVGGPRAAPRSGHHETGLAGPRRLSPALRHRDCRAQLAGPWGPAGPRGVRPVRHHGGRGCRSRLSRETARVGRVAGGLRPGEVRGAAAARGGDRSGTAGVRLRQAERVDPAATCGLQISWVSLCKRLENCSSYDYLNEN